MSNPTPNIGDLLASAQADGNLSTAAAAALNIPDLGAQIQAGLGINVDDVAASEVNLVTWDIDDSSSMAPMANEVIFGYNAALDDWLATKQRDTILVGTRYINGTILQPYTLVGQAVRMSATNYHARGSTPLFTDAMVTLGTVAAKTQEFADNGVPARSITIIMTDGGDNSHGTTAAQVKTVVDSLRRAETHIVIGIGIDDGYTDFRAVFQSMGIPDEWIMTPKDRKELRQALNFVSRSVIRASQSAGNFSQTALGGFGG